MQNFVKFQAFAVSRAPLVFVVIYEVKFWYT